MSVRKLQLCVRLLGGGAPAPLGGALILGIAPDGVGLAPVGKDQLHLGRGIWQGVFGAEHGGASGVSAGLVVESIGDGIEDGGLPRPCVPGNQVQALGPQLLQLQLHLAGIGPKGGHSQFQRSHASPSHICSISSRAKSRWIWSMGRPFCCS